MSTPIDTDEIRAEVEMRDRHEFIWRQVLGLCDEIDRLRARVVTGPHGAVWRWEDAPGIDPGAVVAPGPVCGHEAEIAKLRADVAVMLPIVEAVAIPAPLNEQHWAAARRFLDARKVGPAK